MCMCMCPTVLFACCEAAGGLLFCPATSLQYHQHSLCVALPLCSAAAVIKRLLLVLLVGVGLGTALFFAGLETLFPKY